MLKRALLAADNILDHITKYAIYIAGFITLLMALVTTFGVVMRYVFKNPEHFTYEIAIFCLISSVALSLAYIQRQSRNIRVDFVSNYFPPKVQEILLGIVVPLIALGYLVPLVCTSWEDAWYSLSIGQRTYSAWGPYVGPFKLFIPVGAGLLCIVLISQLIRGIIDLTRKQPDR
jgi:TRAP-type C4-dicarboxylate transport system permease small subunit